MTQVTPHPSKPRRMPYIKMCGFVDPIEARTAVHLGADLIGLNFYSGSPRAVSFGLALKIQDVVHRAGAARDSKRPVRTVAILVNPDIELVLEVMREVQPDILQFHGDEPASFCRYFRQPFIKAFRLRGAVDIPRIEEYLGGYCVGFLLDGAADSELGGTGKQVSMPLAQEALKLPRGFLAGGLTPKNVAGLVRQLRPYGVDVASGIETRPGRKSPELMAEFVRAVRDGITLG